MDGQHNYISRMRSSQSNKRNGRGRPNTGMVLTRYKDTIMLPVNIAPAGVTAAAVKLSSLFPGLSGSSANNRVITWTKSVIEALPTLGNGRISMQAQLSEEYLPGTQFGFGSSAFKLLSHTNSTYMTLNLSTMARVAPNVLRPYLNDSTTEALQILTRLWDDEVETRSVLLRITSYCSVFPQGNIVAIIPIVRTLRDPNAIENRSLPLMENQPPESEVSESGEVTLSEV